MFGRVTITLGIGPHSDIRVVNCFTAASDAGLCNAAIQRRR